MATLKHKLTEAPRPPDRGVRAATFRLLLDTAMEIIHEAGHIPSVAEVALRSRVSRATAYRYFPSRSVLITAVIDRSLGPVRSFESKATDGRERVRELFRRPFRASRNSSHRCAPRCSLPLEQWALERAGLLEEETYRRGHRVRILEHAIAPLATKMHAGVARPPAPRAVGDLRHRAVGGAEGHLGPARPRGRAHRAVDGRRGDRCRAARGPSCAGHAAPCPRRVTGARPRRRFLARGSRSRSIS